VNVHERMAALQSKATKQADAQRSERAEAARRNREKYPEFAAFVDRVRSVSPTAKVAHLAPSRVPSALGDVVMCRDCIRYVVTNPKRSMTDKRCLLDPEFKPNPGIPRRCDDYTAREKPHPASGGSRGVERRIPQGNAATNKAGRTDSKLNNHGASRDSKRSAPGAPDHARTADLFSGPTAPHGR